MDSVGEIISSSSVCLVWMVDDEAVSSVIAIAIVFILVPAMITTRRINNDLHRGPHSFRLLIFIFVFFSTIFLICGYIFVPFLPSFFGTLDTYLMFRLIGDC
mmetsp:Transcript_19534/g.26808  ORF Transcript_19534/g.26808 Transcript_19534/m.26808 type:complete len:102 (-) Transcript_19534:82-387(-)